MRIAVAIVNHNTCKHLQACLSSIQKDEEVEVIVVDNDSRDGSAEMVEENFPWVQLYANSNNPGYGAAANLAIGKCRAPYILLLNSDTLLHPGTLKNLRKYLDTHPKAAIVGPRLLNLDGTLQPSCYAFPTLVHIFLEESTLGRTIGNIPILRDHYLRSWSHNHDRVVHWVLGAALAIRRKSFLSVGGFDPSFFMFAEEVDLCYRLQKAGWQTHFTPRATVTHTGGASIRQYRAKMAVTFFDSMLYFYRLHYSKVDLYVFVIIMKTIVSARLIRDTLYLCITDQPVKKAWIIEGISAWRRILTHRIE